MAIIRAITSKSIRGWIVLGMAVLAGAAVACSSSVNPDGDGQTPSATATAAGGAASIDTPENDFVSAGGVEANPDFEAELQRSGIPARVWETDFRFHTISYDEVTANVVARDIIPSIDFPKFVTPEEASEWIGELEPVIIVELQGEAKAYPLQIMTWHEIVNDVIAGVPVAVTFCPLCNSAIVFPRDVNGEVLEFGVSGNLRNSDLIMYDRQTQSWWQQFTGEGIVGRFAGWQLDILPSAIISFEDFRNNHPDGEVLSRDTGFFRDYGRNPYAGYDRIDNSPFLFDGSTDERLLPKERVAAVTIDGIDAAFPYSRLEEEQVVNYRVGESDVVVFFKKGAKSALDNTVINNSKDVGSAGVFVPVARGQKLTFSSTGDAFVDDQTGSTWNILGDAISGPLAGEMLERLAHGDHFWFAWAAFKPETQVYQGMTSASLSTDVTPTSVPTASLPPPAPVNSDFHDSGLFTAGWNTDFNKSTVSLSEITPVLRRDGIPAIDAPSFVGFAEANQWLGDVEPVIAFENNDDAKAYPLQILTWHEIVNDVVGGMPIAATFCPLCNSAIVFDRRVDGEVYDFGVSGNLRNSDLIMYDRQTHSWWQQLTGEGIVGSFAGRQLELLPSSIISYADFKAAHPDGEVLSRDTGHNRPYGNNPYSGYDRADNPPFLFDGETDGRLLPKERVVAINIGEVYAAFPYKVLEVEQVVSYTLNGEDLVIFYKDGTASALDRSVIRESRNVGATGVFSPILDGQLLRFEAVGDAFMDIETGSEWDILGRAVNGPLTGEQLTPIVHGDHFWFAWGAFNPDTLVYQGES